MKTRNYQIDEQRTYAKFYSITEITIDINITELEAEQMFHALILWDRS